MKYVVLIESSAVAGAYAAEAVRLLGFEPLYLCGLAKYQADTHARILRFEHIDTDTTDSAKVVATLRERGLEGKIAGITSFLDTHLKVACEAAMQLSVPGLDPSILLLKDKYYVAELIPEFSPPSIFFRPHEIPIAELTKLMLRTGQIMIKPTQGAGALGAFAIQNEGQIAKLHESIADQHVPTYLDENRWIAQAFIPGKLVSVEGYVISGAIQTLGFTNRTKVGSTESTAMFPIDQDIHSSIRQKVSDALQALIKRSGFRNGYFHIEFMVTETDAYLIDANMGRFGGGALVEQIAQSFGRTPAELCRHIIQVSLFAGRDIDPELYAAKPRESLSILYGIAPGGTVQKVDLPADLRCFHTQVVGSGGVVSPMGQDDWSWVGLLSGYTADARAAAESIRVQTAAGEFSPCY